MKTKQTYWLILLILMLGACTERITVELDETYTRIAVDGRITTDSTYQEITLTKSADYFYNQPIPMVNNATVSVFDGETTYSFYETEPGVSGIYRSEIPFAGKIGKTYSMEINLQEPISGNTYYTGYSDLPGVTTLDSIGYEYHPEIGKEGGYLLTVYAMEPGDEVNFYMFNWYKNGVLMNDSLDNLSITDDQYINGNYINGAAIIWVSNASSWEHLEDGDTITIRMSGITKDYYNFLFEVQLSQFNIPLFSGPPANVSSNINNGAVGFFAAYSSTFATVIFKKEN
jgi:hypothetical protein